MKIDSRIMKGSYWWMVSGRKSRCIPSYWRLSSISATRPVDMHNSEER